MRNEIICPINMFDAQQVLILPDESTVRLDTEDIMNYVNNTTFSVNAIHFYGNAEYINGLIKNTLFGIKDMEVKIN